MKPFKQHSGVAAPMLRANIDTDAIIPSREMKRVSKKGLAGGLFADWRYLYKGTEKTGPNPEFVLNQPGYEESSILLGGDNFGCGSSREFAVWALAEYGIRAIIAPSFGSIFFNNCIRNGVLPIVLPQEVVESLAKQVEQAPTTNKIHIDLENCSVIGSDNKLHHFEIPQLAKEMLLNGLDAIDLTLQYKTKIEEFKNKDRQRRPWAYL